MLKLRLVSLAALCFLSPALVFGQAVNGRIDGSTKDAAGAIVPGVTVVIQNIATGITRSAQGSSDGAFSFAEANEQCGRGHQRQVFTRIGLERRRVSGSQMCVRESGHFARHLIHEGNLV